MYPLYKLITPLVTGTGFSSTPSTRFTKVASNKHQLRILLPLKPKVTTYISLETVVVVTTRSLVTFKVQE